ncbi:rod shape-determining protein RodA [Oligoflexaceae bacterium]|nr:rod shape-determining protein RodA [Oligoflexaceae bacterium]
MYTKNYDSERSGQYANAGQSINKTKNELLYLFIFSVLTITALGLWNLYSASFSMPGIFNVQIRHISVALISAVVIGFVIPIKYFKHYGYPIYVISVLMLLIVVINGHTSNGSTRWLKFGPVGIQPSELAKIAVTIVVAKFFSDYSVGGTYRLRDMIPVLLMVGLVFALIFIQPDFGTAGICLLIAVSQIAFVRIDLRSIAAVVGTGVLMIPVGWYVLLRGYQKTRILMMFNPELDPHGKGYNSIQSLVAIGSGQSFGKGFMQGTQTQLQFLPARHTDFVFSVFAEEHGFWFGTGLFILYAISTICMIEMARGLKDTFSSLICIGIGAMIFSQFFINIAMVLGIFPVVGMTLPFFSFGGSSFLTLGIGAGLVIAAKRQKTAFRKSM